MAADSRRLFHSYIEEKHLHIILSGDINFRTHVVGLTYYFFKVFDVQINWKNIAHCRSFAANSGANAPVLPKGRPSTANSGTKVAVLLGINRCCSFPLLSAPYSLSLGSEQTLKDLKRSQGPNVEVRRMDLAN